MLDAQARQMILGLDVVDAGFAFLHQPFHKRVPQRNMLNTKTVGAVAGDAQRRRVVNVQWHAAETLVEAQL